jgi:hypothetical protein
MAMIQEQLCFLKKSARKKIFSLNSTKNPLQPNESKLTTPAATGRFKLKTRRVQAFILEINPRTDSPWRKPPTSPPFCEQVDTNRFFLASGQLLTESENFHFLRRAG